MKIDPDEDLPEFSAIVAVIFLTEGTSMMDTTPVTTSEWGLIFSLIGVVLMGLAVYTQDNESE